MSRRVRIFAPSLPLEFSLCVLHQLNYTSGWMELFPAVYYYRQPAAPPVDNTSIFSNGEHHVNHSVAEASKWQLINPKITYFNIFCGWFWVEYALIRDIWGLSQQTAGMWRLQCSICNQIWKYLLIHSYHFHPDDRGSKFFRSVCYMPYNPKCHIQRNHNLNAHRRESITVTQRSWYCRLSCKTQMEIWKMRNITRILSAWIRATSCKKYS